MWIFRARLGLVALLSVLPAFGVVVYTQAVGRAHAREARREQALEVASTSADDQRDAIEGMDLLLHTLSDMPALRSMPRGNAAAGGCDAVLHNVLADHPRYVSIAVLDHADRLCGADAGAAPGVDPPPTAEPARGMSVTYVSDHGRVIATVSRRMPASPGAAAPVIRAEMYLPDLSNSFTPSELPGGATVFLRDSLGHPLARYPAETPSRDAAADLEWATPADARLYGDLSVAVAFDPSAASVVTSRLLARQLWLLAAMAICVILVALVAAESLVVRPVRALSRATRWLAAGDFTARAPALAGMPLIRELAASINVMAQSIGAGVHERDRAAQALAASEQRYRLLFDLNPHAMWVYDRETFKFLEVNDAAIRRYGYSRDEFLAMSVTAIRPPEEVPRFLESQADPERQYWHEHGRWTHVRRSGERLDVSISRHNLEFNGRPAALVVAEDITEQRAAEAARDASDARFRQIAETVTQVFWMATPDISRMLYISPAYEAIWGRTCQSLYDAPRSFLDAVHADDRAWLTEALCKSRRGNGQPFDHTFRVVRPDGTVRWVRDRGFPVRDETGAPATFVGSAEDVTDRRQLELELQQSQKMEAIGILAGGVAHDFNNLLTAIHGYAELIRDSLPDADQARDDAAEITKAADRATALTRQLLAFSRKQVLETRVIRLGDVVAGVAPMLRRLMGETVALDTSAADTTLVKADPSQIEQILINLAVNARDAMPNGGRIRVETRNAPGGVALTVADTGHGMDEATRQRIFEPFFTTKPKGQGTGLGLSTVYGIVKQSGGDITVQSAPGAGTSFAITLPATSEMPSAAKPAVRPARQRGRGEAVLVVEDEDGVREFVTRVLTRDGYSVDAVSSPRQALEIAATRATAIDVVLTDVVLPDMSGPAMAVELQRLHPETRVLYMSGYTNNALERHGLAAGDVSLIMKPFTGDVLLGHIRQAISMAE